jgi:alpha-mannosidase
MIRLSYKFAILIGMASSRLQLFPQLEPSPSPALTPPSVGFPDQTPPSQNLTNETSPSKPVKKVMTVHVVPHSHDDVGWLKTVDQYFDGSAKNVQFTNVNIELTTVIDALLDNPARKFTEVEMKFFKMWWDKQSDAKKDQVRGLVANGQLELVSAGWSMHDEACAIYDDMINNMMIGHDFVLREFGVKPRIGWQLDPFGHSNVNTRLFAEMGFDALFFARLDYKDKERRITDKELEWVWRPNLDSLGKQTQLFTHTLYNHYNSPVGFDWDVLSDD